MKRTFITVLAAMMAFAVAQAENIENVAETTAPETKVEKTEKNKKEVKYNENGEIIRSFQG